MRNVNKSDVIDVLFADNDIELDLSPYEDNESAVSSESKTDATVEEEPKDNKRSTGNPQYLTLFSRSFNRLAKDSRGQSR